MDLMAINETEMYLAIDKSLKQNKKSEITVFCAIYGNTENSLKTANSSELKAFATKYTRNNKGFYEVYLSQ